MKAISKGPILKLRKALLFYALGPIFLILGTSLYFGYLTNPSSTGNYFLYLILVPLGAIILAIGALYMYTGFNDLKEMDSEYGLGTIGAAVQAIALVIYVASAWIFASNLVAGFVNLASFPLAEFGSLITVIGFYKMGKDYKVVMIHSGMVAYLVLPIIGPLVLRAGLGKLM